MAVMDDCALRALPAVEQALGYNFRDRLLLLTALTHRSFCHENNTSSGDFDELEWLGDSVLQLAVSSWLFRSAKGSRRSSGQLSVTRQRFVDAGACTAFAQQLNLLPFLRIGQGQPVGGTKILGDCFEAVLGAVYVDAGGCTDLQPVHSILARVIPSYDHGSRAQNRNPLLSHHPSARPAEPQTVRAGEPRKLMNLAHRLTQMAKRDIDGTQAGLASEHPSRSPESVRRDPLEVLRDFDGHLRGFQENLLRGGTLSYATPAFISVFGEDVARFFHETATDPESCGLLDNVMAGSSMLRKHFTEAPRGADRVVMEVVPIPSEVRLQCFTVVEFLLVNVLRQGGDAESRVLRLIKSAAHGAETVAVLSTVVSEAATSLLLTGRQRAVVSCGLTGEPPPPHIVAHNPRALLSSPPPASVTGGGGGHLHRGFPRGPDAVCAPGRRLETPPPPPPGGARGVGMHHRRNIFGQWKGRGGGRRGGRRGGF